MRISHIVLAAVTFTASVVQAYDPAYTKYTYDYMDCTSVADRVYSSISDAMRFGDGTYVRGTDIEWDNAFVGCMTSKGYIPEQIS